MAATPDSPAVTPQSTIRGPPPGRQTCRVCGKYGHSAFSCWYRFDENYAAPTNTSDQASTSQYALPTTNAANPPEAAPHAYATFTSFAVADLLKSREEPRHPSKKYKFFKCTIGISLKYLQYIFRLRFLYKKLHLRSGNTASVALLHCEFDPLIPSF